MKLSDILIRLTAFRSVLLSLLLVSPTFAAEPLSLEAGNTVTLVGGNLGSRMMEFRQFETELHLRHPNKNLVIRNLCDGGDTPGFRPHSARTPNDHWAFPGARDLNPKFHRTVGNGFNDSVDKWLHRLDADFVIGFFGYSSSFDGQAGLKRFEDELAAFIKHTKATAYNDDKAPRIAIVSPTAFQDRSADLDVPNGLLENANLQIYTEAMRRVCADEDVLFVDLFTPSKRQFESSPDVLTTDGVQLNAAGYTWLNPILVKALFGEAATDASQKAAVEAAVADKNWCWKNDYKVPNGVHVFGRRYHPYGPANYPAETEKLRQMTDNRDQAIWAAAQGKAFDLAAADAKTRDLPEVKTNYGGEINYLSAEDSKATMKMAEGFEVSVFADEARWPNLANPVQMAFDNKGRLWVAAMPSYPHWLPGDPLPDDKLLVYVDKDGDHVADEEIVWADDLHLPMGFEIAHDGVYCASGTDFVFLRDTDGDDRADSKEIILSGFDDHDTHHSIGAFCADPSGAIMMAEGVFLNTNVETPYGTVRGTDGGFYRYDPNRRHLERALQVSIPNPWGIAFDEWGQGFYLHTSGPSMNWMTMYRTQPQYGHNLRTKDLLTSGRVRPTSGLEFVSSRHFPDDQQGDALICNNIGYQGIKQHKFSESESGYIAEIRHDLLVAGDRNVRPVDLEIAPDGSLYVVDWHNGLVGHMQHNARDPNRDHVHGRILRITAKGRPLVEPAEVAGASIETLLANLTLPEYRSRYRSRRELRGRDTAEVLPALNAWVEGLDQNDPRYEHNLLEALWVTWGANQVDEKLLENCLNAKDHRVRAAAVNVLHYNSQLPGFADLLTAAAEDENGRVQIEVASAASWQPAQIGLPVLKAIEEAAASRVKEPVEAAPQEPSRPGIAEDVKGLFILNPETGDTPVGLIEIKLPGNGIINLSEIEIFSGGKDIASQCKGSQSSIYSGTTKIEKMWDGDKNNFAHTVETENQPWLRFSFDPPRAIETVKLYNRRGFQRRINGAHMTFQTGDKTLAKFTLSAPREDAPEIGSRLPGMDEWLSFTFQNAQAVLSGKAIPETEEIEGEKDTHLEGMARKQWERGRAIYAREGHCGTCHQPDGKGLPGSGFPPLNETEWVNENEERLIKLALKGLWGPIEVKGVKYPGQVPMTGFEHLLNDQELADVLTYVRNSFGNKSGAVSKEKVATIRAQVKDKVGFYKPEELK